MNDPVVIRAEPATLQVRSMARSSAEPSEHRLVIGQDDSGSVREFHAACSCGGFSASHHTDRARLEGLYARHLDRRGVSHG